MFFYSDTSVRAPFKGNIWAMNATKVYLGHYDNLLFLKFLMNNERSSFVEKAQARKETELCEKKLKFWSSHPNYSQADALNGCIELKKKWGTQ